MYLNPVYNGKDENVMTLKKSESNIISEMMADFTLNLTLEDVPNDVIQHGKMLIADTLGVAIASHELEPAKIIEDMLLSLKSQPQATLWGSPNKVQLADAVLYNAVLAHGLDYDDTHARGIVHPSVVAVITALTVGETVKADGKSILEAIVAGWEVIIRLSCATKGRLHTVGYHNTGIFSSFTAACVAAKLMGLSRDVLINAIGLCGSQAAAIQEFLNDGSWVKKIHPGWGCHSAIYALMMAERGFKGPLRVFEGKYGIWNSHIGATDGLEEEFSNLGEAWHTKEINLKLFPVVHSTHANIDLVMSLQKEHNIKAEDIEKIECRIDEHNFNITCQPKEAKYRPKTDYMMRFSLPYLLAIAALRGRVSPWEFDIKNAEDPDLLKMIDKVECISDPSVANPGYFPGWIAITTKDGKTHQRHQPFQKGTPQNPISMSTILEKFGNNVSALIKPQQAVDLQDKVQRFEALAGVDELIESMQISKK